MRTFTLSFFSLLLALSSIAFTQHTSDTIAVRDDSALTLQTTVNKTTGEAREAIEQYFNRKGTNGKTHWGLTTYYAALQIQGYAEPVNLYIRVKKETSESSVIFIAAGKDRDDLINLSNEKAANTAVSRLIEELQKEMSAPL
jgi:hypothetical protein